MDKTAKKTATAPATQAIPEAAKEQCGDRIANAIELFEQTMELHTTTLKELKAANAGMTKALATLDRAIATHTHDNHGRACQPFVVPGG